MISWWIHDQFQNITEIIGIEMNTDISYLCYMIIIKITDISLQRSLIVRISMWGHDITSTPFYRSRLRDYEDITTPFYRSSSCSCVHRTTTRVVIERSDDWTAFIFLHTCTDVIVESISLVVSFNLVVSFQKKLFSTTCSDNIQRNIERWCVWTINSRGL